jgi:Domain of unknown function (DUF4129)
VEPGGAAASRARWAGSALLAVLGVALLLPVVALASRPEGRPAGTLLGADPARVLVDVVTYLFVVLVVLGLLVIVWALWPRPDDEMLALPPRRRWGLSTVVTAILALGLALWLRNGGRLQGLRGAGAAGAGGRPLPSAAAAPARGVPAGVDWIAVAIVVALLAAGAVGLWWVLRPRPAPGIPLARRLQAVLDDAIDDVLAEGDPRRAVIAAWARLERVLDRSGVPRRDSEAPFEYAARAGAALEVEPRWLERLADLFEWARFSTHEVTPAMREEALDRLVAVRDGLRVAT